MIIYLKAALISSNEELGSMVNVTNYSAYICILVGGLVK